jgi:hypothetical protein
MENSFHFVTYKLQTSKKLKNNKKKKQKMFSCINECRYRITIAVGAAGGGERVREKIKRVKCYRRMSVCVCVSCDVGEMRECS